MLTGTNGGHRDRQKERASEKKGNGGVYRLRQGVGEGGVVILKRKPFL